MSGGCGLVQEWDSISLISNLEFISTLTCPLNLFIYVHYVKEKTAFCTLALVELDFWFMIAIKENLCISTELTIARWFPTIFIRFFHVRTVNSWWGRRTALRSILPRNILFATGRGSKDWWVLILMQALLLLIVIVRLFLEVMMVLLGFRQIYRYRSPVIRVYYYVTLW